jgi:RND superfamily putative drug exporter
MGNSKAWAQKKWLRVLIPAVLILVWLGVGAVGGPFFGKISEVADNGFAGFLPSSAESTRVNQELKKFQDDTTLPAIVLFSSDNDLPAPALKAIDAASANVQAINGVVGEVSPAIVSDDKNAAYVVVPVGSTTELQNVIEKVKQSYSKSDTKTVTVQVTGPAGFAAGLNKAFAGIDGILLLTALSVVFVILVIVYRSILLPIIVLLTSIFALSASIMLVWWLAKNDYVDLNGQVQGILFILVIGAATDYSLLFVSRYREALYEYKSKFEAIKISYKGAFEPIIASGGTVIVGLMCLLLSDLKSNKALAPVGAIGIMFAVIAALSFLPSVLYVLGRASFWPIRPSAEQAAVKKHTRRLERGFWHRLGLTVDKHARLTAVISAVVLVALALFSMQLKADGVSQSDLILGTSEARDGQTELSKHFTAGSGSPAQVVVPKSYVEQAVKVIDNTTGTDGVNAVATGTEAGIKPLGKAERMLTDKIKGGVLNQLPANARSPQLVDRLIDSANPFKNASIKTIDGVAVLQVTLSNKADSQAAKDTIVRLRDRLGSLSNKIYVGGPTAVQLDTVDASVHDRTVILPSILIAITIILMLLLRAIIAPIILLISTVLSFAATLGVAALLFNHVFGFPGADPSVVLFGFVFLVALGIDYNIFLMTRVREETIKNGTAKGVIKGLVVTGGVITSAGIVLAATFAALGVIPILFLFQIAFIVAFGVLLDTLIVRSLLVPSLIRWIGPFVWWPSRLKNKR